jgi:hypothetical protein
VYYGYMYVFFPRTNRWERGNGHLSHNIVEVDGSSKNWEKLRIVQGFGGKNLQNDIKNIN